MRRLRVPYLAAIIAQSKSAGAIIASQLTHCVSWGMVGGNLPEAKFH